jgi:hypothetical protein
MFRWGGTLLPQAIGRAMEWPEAFAWKAPRRPLNTAFSMKGS